MDSLKPIKEGTAEVLVPRAFEWWTFLALATDPASQFEHLFFVSKLSPESRVVILDAGLLSEAIHLLKDKPLVIVILWDGYQSYRDKKALLIQAAQLARKVELRFVGTPTAGEIDSVFRWRLLFTQQPETYNSETIFSAGLSKVSFSRPLAKTVLSQRTKLMSAKVIVQLIQAKKVHEYLRSTYVFCGHSGLAQLEKYSAHYGVDRGEMPKDTAGSFFESELVSHWMGAVHGKKGYWANQVVIRALLRFIALRTLATQIGNDLFLNFYPEPNINAYQAGALFKRHVFLDFGGSQGDESVYPRAADLLLLKRKVIRFDLRTPTTDLWNVRHNDQNSVEGFLRGYRDFVISTLDHGGAFLS
jgi:hypothetical protein